VAIALITDFGVRDHFVASVKGVILSIAPEAVIVDITHEIEPHDIRSAALTLAACFREFPLGTVFVAVVDPGVGSDRRAIAVNNGDYYFVAPDNGVISYALQEVFGSGKVDSKVAAVELTVPQFRRESVSSTFHGRDIFAPAAAYLSIGTPLNELGPQVEDLIELHFPRPEQIDDRTIGEVINIDRFGNVVTNLRSHDLPASFQMVIKEHVISKRVGSYAESNDQEPFAIEGSLGLIELSVRDGSAAEVLNVRVGERVVVTAPTSG
jgi:S-adenosylmethionine hydrolase